MQRLALKKDKVAAIPTCIPKVEWFEASHSNPLACGQEAVQEPRHSSVRSLALVFHMVSAGFRIQGISGNASTTGGD